MLEASPHAGAARPGRGRLSRGGPCVGGEEDASSMSAPAARSSPPRSAGLLLHPTSLPGPYGVGDLGPAAYQWVDDLAGARQGWWQILPLGPTGYGASPYQALSAFAGNPLLISPEVLAEEGLLRKADLKPPDLP